MRNERCISPRSSASARVDRPRPTRKRLLRAELHVVGVTGANLALIADAADTAAQFVAVFVYVYSALIFAYVILSWIQIPYALNWLQRFLYDVCEPYIGIFRRLLPPVGPLDLSPVIAIVVLYLLRLLINRVVIDHLH
jgi:YggT family protein